ncbi:glycerophosphoryl diester phosphodiesterase [Choiromyces venosus 120613-1]|uniref:Glycerophosphoryl diester phosphodiesterase n=1 Tax=Choiromyces venosus 120613-1 TaxID=1336337 RepID=A0A3N4KGT9_9PEZI|nr:glycerophosphoryl diester phosphodiesterase [Choiromyces venosus 120613-1]
MGAKAYPIAIGDLYGEARGVQAHRGGLGMRPESTLFAFGYALEIGVDVLEMDTVFTKDGIPVIWHDHRIQSDKCNDTISGANYVGKYIANLTLAQVQTLDCGSQQLANYDQAELHPRVKISTLEEVLDLIDCYGDKTVELNLETKLDPEHTNETFPAETYINNIVPILERRGYADRTYIQSFDWRTIIGIKKKFPKTKTVALLDDTTVVPSGNLGFTWLGGIDLQKEFAGDWVKAAHSINVTVLSPVHGTPSSASVNTPGYKPFTTADVVERAHELGMKVIPWTVDDEVTIDKMFSDGVDEIISNYPERVMWIGRQRGARLGIKRNPSKPQCFARALVT